MADKIYINTTNQKTNIVANDIVTLKDVSWQEIEEVSGRTDIKTLSLEREKLIKKRAFEEIQGMEAVDRDWILNKFFRTLSSWNALYIKQCSDYDMLEYDTYLTYKKAYTNLFRIQSFLENLEPETTGKYDVSKYDTLDEDKSTYLYTWTSDWEAYYTACDELDKIFIVRKQKEYIIKMVTLYQLNTSDTEPPTWQDTDEGWGEKPESKKKSQALWGRTTYYYANDTFTRNRPYLIQGITGSDEDEPIEENMKISLSSDTITWTARGLKLEKDIRLNIEYYDMSKVSVVVLKGTGVTITETQEENIKKIVTPTYAEEMSSSVTIRAFVLEDGQTIAEATCTLYKQLIGKSEAVYLGCFDSVPLSYSHDEVEDHLVLGDWWLCKSKQGTSSEKDFMFSVAYELIDLNTSTLRSAWQIVDDREKLRQTIPDNVAIGGYALSNGEFENLIVTASSLLYGKTTIGKDSNDSLIINSKNTINAETVFNALSNFNGSIVVKGKSYLNDDIVGKGNISAHSIVPETSNSYNLGSSTNLWNGLFVNTLKVGGVTQFSIKSTTSKTYHVVDGTVTELGYLYNWKLLCFKTNSSIFGIAFGKPTSDNSDIDRVDLPSFSVSKDEYNEPNGSITSGLNFRYYFNSVSYYGYSTYYIRSAQIDFINQYFDTINIDNVMQYTNYTVCLAGEMVKTYNVIEDTGIIT